MTLTNQISITGIFGQPEGQKPSEEGTGGAIGPVFPDNKAPSLKNI
jgi:hypothetical protein